MRKERSGLPPVPECGIIGHDGNTVALLGKATSTLKKCGFSVERDELARIMLSGDREFALSVLVSFISPGHVADEYSGEMERLSKSEYGLSSLHLAKTPEATQKCLDEGDSVHDENCYGRTALFYANTPEQVRLLLDEGADPLHEDVFGMKPAFVIRDSESLAVLKSSSPDFASGTNVFGETIGKVCAYHCQSTSFNDSLNKIVKTAESTEILMGDTAPSVLGPLLDKFWGFGSYRPEAVDERMFKLFIRLDMHDDMQKARGKIGAKRFSELESSMLLAGKQGSSVKKDACSL